MKKTINDIARVLNSVTNLSEKQLEDFIYHGASSFVEFKAQFTDYPIKNNKLPNSKKEAPMPRLEIIKTDRNCSYGFIYLLGIVRKNVLGEIVLTTLSYSSSTAENKIPNRLFQDSLNELYELKMPLFYRENEKLHREISLEDEESKNAIPWGLKKKMQDN